MTRVYVDTGIFIDFLTGRRLTGANLRSAGRRGRSLDQVLDDAEQALTSIMRRHEGATSALTFYEVEEAIYKSLAKSTAGLDFAEIYRVAAARSIVPQTVIAIKYFNVSVLDLTSETVDAQLRIVELQTLGIRAADSLHIATASRWNADVILTADKTILGLDNLVPNHDGELMTCCDTDDVLRRL